MKLHLVVYAFLFVTDRVAVDSVVSEPQSLMSLCFELVLNSAA